MLPNRNRSHAIADLLSQGLAAMQLSVEERQFEQLLAYISLLRKWSKTYNLTAVEDPMDLVTLHLLDSLAILPHLVGDRFIDVGSGAGLPGIPLAIMRPKDHFVLLDSNGKKTRFLFQVRTKLKLTNTTEVNVRAEGYTPQLKFDAVLTRAFSDLPTMLQNCHHLIKENGLFLAMKGKWPQQEIDQMPSGYGLLSTAKLCIPGVEGDRHLIKIKGMGREDS
jgi:16S rRNA (guanine527-N7)-methyltransferase